MPLVKSGGKEAFKTNVRTLMHDVGKSPHVQSRKQALAIAYATARRYKASGGNVTGLAKAIDQAHRHHAPGQHPSTIKYKGKTYGLGKALGGPSLSMENMVLRGSSYGLRHEGMINSAVPGRTDKLPMKVRSGSYILPADIPSALGQGNSQAGGEILKKMFSSGPYGLPVMRGAGRSGAMRPMRIQQQTMPRGPKQQRVFARGGTDHEHVPIIAAGGEYIIHPDVVRDVGHGSIKAGHRVLDKFVLDVRKKNVDTLRKLPGPKR